MPTPPPSTKTSLTQRVNARARERWPAIAQVAVRFRGQFAYLDAHLPDGEIMPLCRLRYGGFREHLGICDLSGQPRRVRRQLPAHRTHRRKPRTSPRLRLRALPQRPHRLAGPNTGELTGRTTGAPYDPPMTLHPKWLTELCASAVRAGADPGGTEVIPGNTVDLLAQRAAAARMLVLGSYGTGAWSGMLAGSMALGVMERVRCPVVVVRGHAPQVPPRRGGPIVVGGVDGTQAGLLRRHRRRRPPTRCRRTSGWPRCSIRCATGSAPSGPAPRAARQSSGRAGRCWCCAAARAGPGRR